MTDEELSRAISTVRAAATAEGNQQMVAPLTHLCSLALRRALAHPETADEIRAAVAVLDAWTAEAARAAAGGH